MATGNSHPDEQISHWKDRWDKGQIGFHSAEVSVMLQRYVDRLIPEGRANIILFPLCGKSVDMKWLADRGCHVVGVEGVQVAIEQFFKEQSLAYLVEDLAIVGDKAKVYKSKDGRIHLYLCDFFNFTKELEGTVDVIVDKNSLIALPRQDVARYIQVIKSCLNPGGRILLDVVEYDLSIMDDLEGTVKPPPPFPMYEKDIKTLYEPECSVEFLERYLRTVRGKNVDAVSYLIIKKC